jgi:DNA (cytosine-5)-methyltransferase 1
MLILSLFPGIDMLGRGFEAQGFTVVRGPDLLWGGDIRSFHVPPGRFDGIIAGSPCQDFSRARRAPPTGYGLAMLEEFRRVLEAQPDWWLLENVERVPDVAVTGYQTQRLDLNACECGMAQNRHRHFQFGSHGDLTVIPQRSSRPAQAQQPTCLATEGRKAGRRNWADFCELQGLSREFDLPGLSIEAKYKAVGNGVPVPIARVVARAILAAVNLRSMGGAAETRLCVCGCGRVLAGRSGQRSATAACRKRLEKRRREEPGDGEPGAITFVNHQAV